MKRPSLRPLLKSRHGVRVAVAIVGGCAALGTATIGGTFPSWSSRDPGRTVSGTSGRADGETIQMKSDPVIAMIKADRMPLPAKLALAGSATLPAIASPQAPAREAPRPVSYSVTTQPGYENETFVSPELTYASLDMHDANAPFDRAGTNDPSAAMPAHPSETPEIAEEEDDAQPTTLALPLPHEKPVLEPGIPLPKVRPEAPVITATPTIGHIPPGKPSAVPPSPGDVANAGAIPIRTPSKTSNVLAYLTSPSDAPQPSVTPPMNQPPHTILTPTPFGIPYVLQTQSVDTACLKPELLDILRQIEGHYGQKVVITSGYRSRGREGSLHRTCRAADIIIPGVTSQQLAAYARSISAVGGVGTYCHQSMIHVDVGTPRDWKYGCGSYFAMRNGTAHWGKVPPGVQQAETEAD